MVLLATIIVAGFAFISPAFAATIVYVSNAESNDIQVLQLHPKTGELTLIETVPIPGVVKSGMSTPLAISPDQRFLFVATRVEPQAVFTYAIDAKSGKLKYIGRGPLVDSMPFISTDRTGRHLFAASYPGHKLTVNPINAQGIVQPTQQVLEKQTNAHSMLPDKQNRFVLAATLGNDLLNVFKFDAKTGKLEPHSSTTVQAKTGPRHFVFHPNGKLVYLLGELDATVHVFDWDARNGQLKEKQSVSALLPGTTGRIGAADIHITPNGKFLYATERTSNALAGFKVNAKDGTLSLIEFVPTETQPRTFSIDSSGRYLLVAGQRSHRLSSYQIDASTGKLTKLKDYAAGKNPTWIEIVDLPVR
ncbi:MAG: beta-propeller fold lactonase family protein [Blastocatellia bacterium]|nr:beta-propeller fold lactonase family protein [Blastocatellia bacterium]